MPQGNLPEKAKEVFRKAEVAAKKSCPDGDAECIARKAWAAVKRGWRKVGDKWIPKSTSNFSLYINKAYIDNDTGEARWCAVTSDTDPDLYKDEMSLALYNDFLSRIKSKELPPERHRSDFWSGGMPYLSISHYLDLNGKGVPGSVEDVYVDGNTLKAKGKFNDTPLGQAAYKSVRENFSDGIDEQNKVRISIAFVDWAHRHKSNNYEFIRESLEDFCPECLKELFTGESEGKEFLKGHLIHLALTREPVNQRTIMEVERSMTTQKDDAVSIITEELHEEVFEDVPEELKADLVIKADQEDVDPVPEVERKEKMEEEDDDKKKKKKEDEDEEKSKVVPHVLDSAFESFLAVYDEVAIRADLPYDEKLRVIQGAYEQFGEAVKAGFYPTKEEKEQEVLSEIKSMLTEILDRQNVADQKLAILEQKTLTSNPKEKIPQQPVRRSLTLKDLNLQDPAHSKKMSLSDQIARRSVGIVD